MLVANLQFRLAPTLVHAKELIVGAGVAPCYTIVINENKWESVELFLNKAKPARTSFYHANDLGFVDSSRLRVMRTDIGQAFDVDGLERRGGWNSVDAILVAPSFDDLVEAIDSLSP